MEALREHAFAEGIATGPALIRTPPDARGFEHEVWIHGVPESQPRRVWKATYADEFGHLPQGPAALPLEYLDRLYCQNLLFSDAIQLEAITVSGNDDFYSIRIITSQPFVKGQPSTAEEISGFFLRQGFRHIHMKLRNGWYRDEDRLLCSDTHGGNVLRSPEGKLIAIDVPVVHLPEGELAAWETPD